MMTAPYLSLEPPPARDTGADYIGLIVPLFQAVKLYCRAISASLAGERSVGRAPLALPPIAMELRSMAQSRVQARRSAEKLAHHLYEHEDPYGHDVCVYCGDTATTRDHVPPISQAATMVDLWAAQGRRPQLRLLPACRDCNSRLRGFLSADIAERRAELKRRLKAKHWRLLGNYDWSDEELSELGRNLRSAIEYMEAKRRWLMDRLSFPRPWEAQLLRDGVLR